MQTSSTKQTASTSGRRFRVPRPISAPGFHPVARFLRSFLFSLGVVLQTYIWDIFLARHALTRWYVQRTVMQRWIKVARRFRTLAVEMGGMQIKLGQFLSARADIIPDEVRFELAGLQDEVPAAPANHVLELIMREHGKPPDVLFETFDSQAVAAASLGQVHYATLHGGEEVAVKVQRPHIEDIIEIDLRALKWVLLIIKDYPAVRKRADVMALFDEFSLVLRRELDYVQEAKNADLFRANFAGVPGIYVPRPILDLTTTRVLVMERIGGIKINDGPALDAAGISRCEVADRLNQTYLKQFFLDGFFHADPHPGNLFVRPEQEDSLVHLTNGSTPSDVKAMFWTTNGVCPSAGTPFTIIFVDFGMVGFLPPQTMDTVRNGVLGLATNDAERIVDALFELGMFLPGTDRRPIVQALEIMLKHTYNLKAREVTNIDIEQVFAETHDLVYDLPFQIPQDLLYLGRALSMVSGLATEIEPDINLFDSLRPFARKMLERERDDGNWVEKAQKELTELGQILLGLPRQMDAYYRAANRGELQTRTDLVRVERMLHRVERSTERLSGGVVATGLFLGGVQLRLRGMEKEANRAWLAATLALLWTARPHRNNGGNGRS